jgi:excinuclease ABC subunit C
MAKEDSFTRPDLQDKLDTLPEKSGVYIYKNTAGKVIYVGKAVNLRNRVRSYFHKSAGQSPKTLHLVQEIQNLDFIITDSELEALLLENTLIKKHLPRYNVRLKDDKRYPYIKISWQEPYPRVFTSRRILDDGARYFGPYTASGPAYQTLDLARKIFPYLTCSREITGKDTRACLYYHIGRCSAPCIGAVSQQEYRQIIDNLCKFLGGRTEQVVADLNRQMQAAAEAMDFERAALLRDQMQAIEQTVQKQKVISADLSDQDVIAFARDKASACVQVFFIRNGKLIGREYFLMEGTADEDDRTVLTSFLKQFYDSVNTIPPNILLPQEIDEQLIINDWLKRKRGGAVTIKIPRRGKPKELLQMAAANASETLAHLQAQWDADESKQNEALLELQQALNLPQPPLRIECYDISTLQGTHTTASMVVFVKGIPHKADYRRFKIQNLKGKPDDYASMKEVLQRRFRRMQEGDFDLETGPGDKKQNSWKLIPDLVIIDGGKGQLNAALEILDEYELRDAVPITSLAKQEEELFLPGRENSILLPRHSQALYLVQRIRDEAHRFAIGYNRSLREKKGIASQLDAVSGIGPTRRKQLLKHFGDLDAVRQASVEEIAAVPGLNRALAEKIKAEL